MMRVQPHGGLPECTQRFDLIKILRPLASKLGIRAVDLQYLEYAIERTMKADYETGRICMMWVSVEKMCADLSLSPRQLNRIEQRLEAAHLIRRCLSANKRRFGERDNCKQITFGCGIDLGPMIDRASELKILLKGVQYEFRRLVELRSRCSSILKRLRALGSEDAINRAREVFPRLRPSEVTSHEHLEEICDALKVIASDFEMLSRQTVGTAASDKNVRPDTKTKDKSLTCSKPSQTRNTRTSKPKATPRQIQLLTSQRIQEAIAFYSAGLNESKSNPTWNATIMAIKDSALSVGIRRRDWDAAASEIGEEMVALAFAIVDRNSERDGSTWHVKSIPGAFINLLRNEIAHGRHVERLWAALLHERDPE
ncbi:helix-turn-helix domain-containing protein [Aliiroseovarius sp. KMU-71]|jgi:replication initiation protein RepC|uniref:helix-turn-helix domain-containing protein n=1 Tax=unclassified Aliiroseovarius TaxID=2623558 RepID=UPI003C7BCEC1